MSTIEARPALGPLVRELAANARDGPQFSGSEAFDVILRRLDLLESLSVSWLFSTLPSLPRHTHLTELSYGCTVLRACDLEPLSELVNLTHLEIKFTKFSNEGEDRLGLLTHNHIKVLGLICVEEDDLESPWAVGCARFVDRFPRLEHLSLTRALAPRSEGLLAHLFTPTQSLAALSFATYYLDDPFVPSCDHVLPRFPLSERVDLCRGTASLNLVTHLKRLLKLSHLRLGQDLHYTIPDLSTVFSLVEGPDRLQSLRVLIVDAIEGEEGRPLDVEDMVEDGSVRQSMAEDGWVRPDFGE